MLELAILLNKYSKALIAPLSFYFCLMSMNESGLEMVAAVISSPQYAVPGVIL